MAASFHYDSEDSLQSIKTRLLARFNQLLIEHEQLWSEILERKTTCAEIVLEQVQSNQQFTEFHDMYMEVNLSWPDELQTYPCFLEMLDQVRLLSEWMSDFEPRSNLALRTLTEMATIVTEKHGTLSQLLPSINHSQSLSQLETIDLDHFQWLDPNEHLMPNVEELEQEWRNKDVFRSVENCVLQMRQLFNTPVNVLVSELQFMSENSSSSPDSNSNEGLFS